MALEKLKLKLGRWQYLGQVMPIWSNERNDQVPEWVSEAAEKFYFGYQEVHGVRPYDVTRVFRGDNCIYRVEFVTVGQGEIIPHVYRKLKAPWRARARTRLSTAL